MVNPILRCAVRAQVLAQALKDQSGLDSVEYALVFALLCLGIVAGVGTLADSISTAMTKLYSSLGQASAVA